MHLAISPHFELPLAVAAALSDDVSRHLGDAATRWLGQTRRKVDQGLRRRLGPLADPAVWLRVAAQPRGLPGPDVDTAIEGFATIQGLADADAVVDALRRFDRLAFAALWRSLRADLEEERAPVEAALHANSAEVLCRSLGLDLDPARLANAVFLPSRFAPLGFHAPSQAGRDAVALIAVSLSRLPPAPISPVRTRPAIVDPALVFRALGDATRYAIAGLIARRPMTGAALARALGTSTPTVTHHLKALRQAGLLREEPRGNSVVLTLERAAVERISEAAVRALFDAGGVAPIRRSRRG